MPMENRGVTACWPPYNHQYGQHQPALIDVVPTLHDHPVESHTAIGRRCHEVFVIKSADCSEHGCQYDAQYPSVVFKINALFLSAAT